MAYKVWGLPWADELKAVFNGRVLDAGESIRRVHILTPDIFRVDAVSRHVIEMATVLNLLNIEVDVYCQNCAAEDRDLFLLPSEVHGRHSPASDLVIFHHSIGHAAFEMCAALGGRKAVYYHGVTPPELLSDLDPVTAKLCQKGLDDLPLSGSFQHIAANSKLNLDQMLSARSQGQAPLSTAVLPPFFAMNRWDHVEARGGGASDSLVPFLLYVGRIVPHKNLEACLRVLAALRKIQGNLRLVAVGSIVAGDYYNRLKQEVLRLGLDDAISWVHNADDSALRGYFENAAALIHFSQHEGFAIPVVEAMKLGLPVISHDKTALPETLDGSGLLVDPGNIRECVLRIHEVLASAEARQNLIERQKEVFNRRFSTHVCRELYIDWFAHLML